MGEELYKLLSSWPKTAEFRRLAYFEDGCKKVPIYPKTIVCVPLLKYDL